MRDIDFPALVSEQQNAFKNQNRLNRTPVKVNHICDYMKTTLTISDDLFRQAKAYAALRGQTFGNLIEQSLSKAILDSPSGRDSSKHWVEDLPHLSASAVVDLGRAVNAPDFRTMEPEMWK